MKTNIASIKRAALVVAIAGALSACASAPSSPPPDLAQRIASAQTRADHESLASYYAQEAAKSRQLAAMHQDMGRSYKVQATLGRGLSGVSAHCERLAQSYTASADDYEGMAATHRQQAAQARQ
ncbi:MAG TPA: hypothetical protein VJ743_09525 [Albitalea sp.]|nr:hypothetical protein [Albitalea sp.]